MKISVIVPTIGRPTLTRTLDSCSEADEVIVVLDEKAQVADLNGASGRVAATVQGGDWGYTARTVGMKLATGTHLAFLDDDDVYTPDALALFREAACNMPVIFRMHHKVDGLYWREPKLRFGNVGTPMLLVPNRPRKLGRWEAHNPRARRPGGDYTFIVGCCDKMGEPVWRQETVAEINP